MQIGQRSPQKKHLEGGTLRTAMANEIIDRFNETGGHKEATAVKLGITSRTLEKWLKSWKELSVLLNVTGMETVLSTAERTTKMATTKKASKKKKAAKKSKKKAAKVAATPMV